MKLNRIVITVLFLATITLLFSFDLPDGWNKSGSDKDSYDMGIDIGAGMNGKNAATIRSNKKRIHGFGTLMQECLPNKYLGKRIRMSAYVKSQDVKARAALWLRVDEQNSYIPLSFDNMSDRPIKGTTDWKKYEIVLDVPLNSSIIAFGALLVKTGQIWFSEVNFEIVSDSVPTTGKGKESYMPKKEPTNLNFEK